MLFILQFYQVKYQILLYRLSINQFPEEHMRIIINEIVKNQPFKSSLFLCYIKMTKLMSRSSISTRQVTRISNLIKNCFFFTKSTNISISIFFFIFSSRYNIFLISLKKTAIFFSFFNLINKPIYIIISQRRFIKNHFVKHYPNQILYNKH